MLPLWEKSRAKNASLGRAVLPRGRGDVAINFPLVITLTPLFLSSVSKPLLPFCSSALEILH